MQRAAADISGKASMWESPTEAPKGSASGNGQPVPERGLQPRIVIISPCRDEDVYVRATLDTMVAQTLKPTLWIIVDDGSTDQTPHIVEEYARKHSWIRLVRRADRGKRSVGPGVIDAFYHGLECVDLSEYDYLCKMDCDLELPERYFEEVIRRMEADPRIGTASGKPYYWRKPWWPWGQRKLVSEMCGDENSVGMVKLYRRECYEEVEGFVRQVMWDGIDGHRCRMHGWRACSWDNESIRFTHLRPMGESEKGILTGRTRHGFGQYFMGTDWLYMVFSAVYRMTRPPVVLGGVAMLLGYFGSAIDEVKRYPDEEFRKFLRRYQLNCLRHGKLRATAELDEQQGVIWEANHGSKSSSAD